MIPSHIDANAIGPNTVVIFGGAFDPITKSHGDIIRSVETLIASSQYNVIGVIAISSNDEKQYAEAAFSRTLLVEKELESHAFKWNVIRQRTRMHAFIEEVILKEWNGAHVTLVLGQDEYESLLRKEWVDSDWIIENCKFIVYRRMEDSCSSTKVRKLMKYNPLFADTFSRIADNTLINCAVAQEIAVDNLYNQYSLPAMCKYSSEAMMEYANRTPSKIAEALDQYRKGAVSLKDAIEMVEKADYKHPSVTATMIIHDKDNDKYAIIRRGGHPFKNYWAFPGGFAEPNDSAIEQTAQRELDEECSILLDFDRFEQITLMPENDPRGWVLDMIVSADVTADEAKYMHSGDDAHEIDWVSGKDMPTLAFRHNVAFKTYCQKKGLQYEV